MSDNPQIVTCSSILWETNDLIAVAKPEGMATIPENAQDERCMLSQLKRLLAIPIYVVHRLDKEVSGVLLFAKNATSHRDLNILFRDRRISKTYLAVTHGEIAGEIGCIDSPIREFGSGRMGVDTKLGKPCCTQYEVTNRMAGYTQVKVCPETGRRHQIRVHFYSIGHPLVGDCKYGEQEIQKSFPRLLLHAFALAFTLPSGEDGNIVCPLPASFTAAVSHLTE